MGAVEAARAAAAESEAQAAEAERDAAQAEATRVAAVEQARIDPTPENIREAAEATTAATTAQRQAATKRRAATAQADAVIDAQLRDISQQIEAAQSSARAAKENPNGYTLLTDLHWDWHTLGNVSRLVTNNFAVRVVGAEKRVSLGLFGTFIGGAKVEICLASKHGVIGGYEGKYVLGTNVNYFGGLKMDTIGGAKRDLVYGSKYEAHAGFKLSKGPKDATEEPIRDLLRSTRAAIVKNFKSIVTKRSDQTGTSVQSSKQMLEELASLSETVGAWIQKSTEITEKFSTMTTTGATLVIRTSGKTYINASGDTTLEGGGSQLKLAGSVTLKGPGASITVDGSGVATGNNTKIC